MCAMRNLQCAQRDLRNVPYVQRAMCAIAHDMQCVPHAMCAMCSVPCAQCDMRDMPCAQRTMRGFAFR